MSEVLADAKAAPRPARGTGFALRFALLALSVALATAISIAAHETHHPVTGANVFIVAVLVNGAVFGLGQGLATAVVVSVIYDFFIRFPVYERGVNVIDDLLPIFALTTTALVSGLVSGQLRSRVASTERARAELSQLLDYSRELHRAVNLEEIARNLVAAADPRLLEASLAALRREHAFRDRARWEEAVAEAMRERRPSDEAKSPKLATKLDQRAIVGLTIMAIDRCELLEETAAAEAAIRSDKLKSALLSSLSHDLRTPLAAITTSASNLAQLGSSLGEEERERMIATIQQQCKRLNDFTTKLMSLGRLEGGLSDADMDLVDLEEAIDSALAAVRPAAQDRVIERRIEAESVFTKASPLLLEQALTNLIENALRYSAADRPVTVSLRREGACAAIAIADEGPGIPTNDLPRVFERFYRGANAVGRPGHGLGLSIVKAFTDAMGGTIELRNPAAGEGGTEVTVRLPALDLVIDSEED